MPNGKTSSTPNIDDAKQRLSSEINAAAEEADALLQKGAEAMKEGTEEVANNFQHLWEVAQETCEKLQTEAVEAAKATDQAIRRNPYPAVGIAFGIGLLAGLLLKRK